MNIITFTLGIVHVLDFSIVSLPCAFDNGGHYLQIFYYKSELKTWYSIRLLWPILPMWTVPCVFMYVLVPYTC